MQPQFLGTLESGTPCLSIRTWSPWAGILPHVPSAVGSGVCLPSVFVESTQCLEVPACPALGAGTRDAQGPIWSLCFREVSESLSPCCCFLQFIPSFCYIPKVSNACHLFLSIASLDLELESLRLWFDGWTRNSWPLWYSVILIVRFQTTICWVMLIYFQEFKALLFVASHASQLAPGKSCLFLFSRRLRAWCSWNPLINDSPDLFQLLQCGQDQFWTFLEFTRL